MTGGRILNARKYLEGETFMCTYGDGLSDVDLNHLLKYHQSKSSVATVTSVRPPARFGEILADDKGYVSSFREKPQTESGWINGGFRVRATIFDFIADPETVLEKTPLEIFLEPTFYLSAYRFLAMYGH